MSDKHPLRTFILGTAIGGLLLGLLQWITGFISPVWQACKSASIWSFRFLLSSVSVPVWLILVISPLIISTLIRIFAAFKQKDIDHLTWRDYNQDEIMGMKWRWSYNYYNGNIDNIACFCPSDDTQLVYESGYPHGSFRCETCLREFEPRKGNLNYMLGMVKRQIHRRIRTGEWKEVVEKHLEQ